MAEEDLIFGKNRHFFGGIEPSNMLVFSVAVESGVVKVTATLPNDTVVNNQTLCTVEGAIIRRKTTDYPKDEFDGDLVANIKASTVFADSGASPTGTYYYAAFPYTTQGVYNRNKANRVVVNEPEPMQEFSAKSVYVSASDTVKVEITAKLPSGVAGAVIRRSMTGYPTSETEGELFKNITANGTYMDTNVTVGVVYYYSAFPYTSTGAYAKANGNDWYTEVLADRLLLQDLLVMMARSTECQTAFGYGRCKSSNSNAIASGTMNTKGMFWGSNDQTSGVKVFGMENVWGNLWRRTAGWINANGTQKVKLTRGTHDGSTVTDYNTDGNGYKMIANATPAGSSGGYISSMKTEAFGRLPVNASGSSSTYEADGMWYNNSQVNYAFVGGPWANGLMVGPFCASLGYAASNSNSAIGAALSCKPLAAA